MTLGDRRVAALPMEPAFRAPDGGCGLEERAALVVLWAAVRVFLGSGDKD